jgi:hypothetical protein
MAIAYDTSPPPTSPDTAPLPRARAAGLSAAKRYALVACLDAGGLNRKNGFWHGLADGKPICGVTVADLARDGLMTVSTENRLGTARLTERGYSFARALLGDAAGAEAGPQG